MIARRALLATTGIAATLALAGCGSSGDKRGGESGWQTVRDADVPFTFQVPSDWQVDNRPKEPLLVRALTAPRDYIEVRKASDSTGRLFDLLEPSLIQDIESQGFEVERGKERHSGAEMTTLKMTKGNVRGKSYVFPLRGVTWQILCSVVERPAEVGAACRRMLATLNER